MLKRYSKMPIKRSSTLDLTAATSDVITYAVAPDGKTLTVIDQDKAVDRTDTFVA
jgi:hypothetical protein